MKNYYNFNLTNEQKQYAKETDDFLYELDICKLVVFGLGYVGLAMATLLSLDNEVVAIDINEDKISKINNRISPIKDKGLEVILYEPYYNTEELFLDCVVVNKIDEFKSKADLIIANRNDECLDSVRNKVYTRDIFGRD